MPRITTNVTQKYKPNLCKFMTYLDRPEAAYPRTMNFERDRLLQIRPEDVAKYLNFLAYGTETPGPNDHPNQMRSSSLGMVKKSISHFMPNQQHWVVDHNVGNPTKSVAVNIVIKAVKLAEVRRLGRPSNAKRDMKRAEFKKTLRLLEDHRGLGDFDTASKFPTMMKLQFHIIGRTDDLTNIETADLKSHSQFPDTALQMKVNWSKNVLDERDCPDQLILGAMDDDFCCLVALGCYLESKLGGNVGNKFLFCEQDHDMEPQRLNNRYYRILKAVWRNPDFQELLQRTRGNVGTHSLRKFPSTWCAEHGATTADIEVRGRWKGTNGTRVVGRSYVSPVQLPTDARLASMLCVGGPVKYKLKPDSHVSEQFLQECVAPAMTGFFREESNHIAEILALPVLYAAHVPALAHMFKPAVRARIVNGYAAIRQQHPADYNPVQKVPLHVFQVENTVHIEEMEPTGDAAANAGNNPIRLSASQGGANRHDTQSILLSLNRIQQTQAQHQQQNVVSYIYVFSLLYIVAIYLTECIACCS